MKAIRHIIPASLLLFALVWGGCTESDEYDTSDGHEIRFDNATLLIAKNKTRSITRSTDDKDWANDEYKGLEATDTTIYLSGEKSWGNVRMYMTVNDVNADGVQEYTYGSAAKGQLVSADGNSSLKWSSDPDAIHKFVAWTQPQAEDGSSPITMNSDNTGGVVHFGPNYDEAKQALEYFIGTQRGPLTFRDNGMSVALLFHHLVTKICISRITVLDSGGRATDITHNTWDSQEEYFYGIRFTQMPQKGIFTTNIEEMKMPTVVKDLDSATGVMVTDQKTMHLPPFPFDDYGEIIVYTGRQETDPPGVLQVRAYYGHLRDLSGNITELKTGEAMALDLMLSEGRVTGMSAWICDWNDMAWEETTMVARHGIYTQEDWDTFVEALQSGNSVELDKYCTEDETGNKVICIYNNLKISLNGNTTLTIPHGYKLDGMGHNLKVSGGTLTLGGDVTELYIDGVKQP